MIALFRFLLALLTAPFRPMWRLEAENTALRNQLHVLRRRMKARPRLTNSDRWFFVILYRLFPSILDAIRIIQPETLVLMASIRFPVLLALEVAPSRRLSENRRRITHADQAYD